MTTVHLLRHGEVYNPDHVLYGRLPGFRLSDLGQRQAKAAAAWLATRDLSYLVASPLERAQQTAAPIAALTGLTLHTDERLIEADNKFTGERVSTGRELLLHPSHWKHLRNPMTPSWGEPYDQIAARMVAAARSARDAADGREAVCVSHQLPIVTARRSVEVLRLAHDPRRRQCALASVTSFVFDGDAIVRVDYRQPAAELPSGQGAGA